MIKNNVYAILDFDGFVCKSFYANKEDPMNLYAARNILRDLVQAAVEKTARYFNCKENFVTVVALMSGHSWKKDIYPSYKRSRKKDEYLGIYREEIKKLSSVQVIQQLEADEAIVLLSDYLQDIGHKEFIVFSDDKDLRYYCPVYCKINITEEIQEADALEIYSKQLEQMIIGDGEDNIKGIPKVGEKTAPKLLAQYGYDLKGVIRCFRDKEVDIDNCLRDLLLVVPLEEIYREKTDSTEKVSKDILTKSEVNDYEVMQLIISQIQYLNNIVKEVYDEIKKS